MLCAALRGLGVEQEDPLLRGPAVVDPDRSAFYRQRLLGVGWGGGREGGRGKICSASEALLRFICIASLKSSGSGRLTALQVSVCTALLGKVRSHRAARRAEPGCRRRTALLGQRHRTPRLSEKGHAAPGAGTVLTASLRSGWFAPPLPPFLTLFFLREIHGESLR